MDKNLDKIEVELESVRAIERRRIAIERTSARAPKTRIERTCVRMHKKEIDHRSIDRSPIAIERTCA